MTKTLYLLSDHIKLEVEATKFTLYVNDKFYFSGVLELLCVCSSVIKLSFLESISEPEIAFVRDFFTTIEFSANYAVSTRKAITVPELVNLTVSTFIETVKDSSASQLKYIPSWYMSSDIEPIQTL